MGDGFAQPDPAPVDDDPEVDELPAMLEDTNKAEQLLIVDGGASCHNCSHFEVCALYKSFAPMLNDWHTEEEEVQEETDAERPIEPHWFARICRKYDPVPEDDNGVT